MRRQNQRPKQNKKSTFRVCSCKTYSKSAAAKKRPVATKAQVSEIFVAAETRGVFVAAKLISSLQNSSRFYSPPKAQTLCCRREAHVCCGSQSPCCRRKAHGLQTQPISLRLQAYTLQRQNFAASDFKLCHRRPVNNTQSILTREN